MLLIYRSAAVLMLCALLSAAVVAQDLLVRVSKDELQVSAPRLRFLTGKPLERLRSGNAVAFDFQVTVLADSKQTVLRRAFERFVVSYDIWEETFAVTRMRSARSGASRLSARAAEAWCYEGLSMAASGLPLDTPVWVRLDVRAQPPRPRSAAEDEGPLGLSSLVEIFSRAKPQDAEQWRVEAGPVKLSTLLRGAGGGD